MPTKISKQTFDIPCESYGCFTRASWVIGHPEITPSACFSLCDACMDDIARTIPLDKLPSAPNMAYKEMLEEVALAIKGGKLTEQQVFSALGIEVYEDTAPQHMVTYEEMERSQLEAMCDQLGIQYQSHYRDETLIKKIREAQGE